MKDEGLGVILFGMIYVAFVVVVGLLVQFLATLPGLDVAILLAAVASIAFPANGSLSRLTKAGGVVKGAGIRAAVTVLVNRVLGTLRRIFKGNQ